jgi:hypothetical protein
MQSDLIGVYATVAVVVIVGLALVIFLVVGPIAGILFGAAIVALSFYLVSLTSRGPADIADIAPPSAETAQQVLVIANQGLGNPALDSEVALRAERGPLELKLIAPAPASSLARRISDDVDVEITRAHERISAAVERLSATGVTASGQVDEEAEPMRCLLDGLREFPADEVLLVPGDEQDWSDAESLADRIRAETGVRVTELGG